MVRGMSWYLDWAGQEVCSQAGSLCSLSCPPISQGSYSQNSLSVLPGLVSPPRAAGRGCSFLEGDGQEHCPLNSISFASSSEGLSTCLSHFTQHHQLCPQSCSIRIPRDHHCSLSSPTRSLSSQVSKVQVSKWDLEGSGLCFPEECRCQLGLP